MKILVIGTWKPIKTKEYKLQAQELGYELAKRNHTLVASPSSGIQGLIAKSYKEHGGKKFIGYYPELELMKQMNEETLIQPDIPIYTKEDYPIRNILQVKGSDAVIGLTGGSGTLTELIASVSDYNLPTAFYKGSSVIVDSFRKIEPDFSKIYFGTDIVKLVDFVEKSYNK